MSETRAYVLCGGRGRRLQPLTDSVPKPMVEVSGRPLLEWVLRLLAAHGVNEAVLMVAYRGEAIEEFFGDTFLDMGILYNHEDPEHRLGTGGALKLALENFPATDTFIATNGDILTDANVTEMVGFHRESEAMGTILGYPLPCPYGVMYLEDGCRITRFEEKPRIPEYPINAGYYVFEPEVLDSLPDRGAMELTAFPKIAEMGRMYCYLPDGIYWSDVGTHKDLENAEKDVSSGKLVLQ